uniref:Uncharacterized protein n=1 Tax=Hucho hucho TaxID=62062 RepID=A0A4W5R288_9TELE
MFSSCAVIGSVFCHAWRHYIAAKSIGSSNSSPLGAKAQVGVWSKSWFKVLFSKLKRINIQNHGPEKVEHMPHSDTWKISYFSEFTGKISFERSSNPLTLWVDPGEVCCRYEPCFHGGQFLWIVASGKPVLPLPKICPSGPPRPPHYVFRHQGRPTQPFTHNGWALPGQRGGHGYWCGTPGLAYCLGPL